jgi:acyl-coenzyme A thioesterase PaaI-like protein
MDFKIRVQESLGWQEVMRTLGIEIARLEPGETTLTMPFAAAYTQPAWRAGGRSAATR